MIIFILKVAVLLLLLIVAHELGHVICARLLGLKIKNVGFTLIPFPHVYVAVRWPRENRKRLIYLFSGFMVYLLIFIFCWINGFFGSQALIYALGIQALIETNPVYSDFVIAQTMNNTWKKVKKQGKSYKRAAQTSLKNHLFSSKWYIHFSVWTLLIVFFFNQIQ
jgi:Zn-dependent protease